MSQKTPQGRGSRNTKPKQSVHTPLKSKEKKSPTKGAKVLCKECHAVYNGKNWQAFAKTSPDMMDELRVGICPACHEKIGHLSDGVLHLSGPGIKAHKKEIQNIIKNAGIREEERDILNRIERIEDNGNEMVIYTTKNQLAVEIGKKVSSAYKGGTLDIKWSKGDKPVEVKWYYEGKK